MPPEDYAAAATRHFHDGVLLHENKRNANADQLFGFAAECAIKTALTTLPGCANGNVLAQMYRAHVDRLWCIAPLHGIQKRYPALVLVLKELRQPFADWSTDQRYGPDGMVTDEALGRHRQAARRVLGSAGLIGIRREA